MFKKYIITSAIVFAALGVSSLALAVESSDTTPHESAATTARIEKFKTRAGQEIDRRVNALNKLIDRMTNMKRISDSDKNTLKTEMQGQMSDLTTLKTKIDADIDVTTLKTDVDLVTKSYRIFALVLPRNHIVANGDAIATSATDFATLGAKLADRIAKLETSGKDVTSLKTMLSDMQIKITDAVTQAQNAIKAVAQLQPDNGDEAVMKTNETALKNARILLKTGSKDLKDAREIVKQILKAIKDLEKTPSTPPASGNQ